MGPVENLFRGAHFLSDGTGDQRFAGASPCIRGSQKARSA